MRHFIMIILAAVCSTGFLGCGLKQEMQEMKETRNRVKNNLEEIKNHGGIDHDTMRMIQSVDTAYRAYLDRNNKPPTKWSDLAAAPGLTTDARGHIRTAKSKIKDIVWGAKLENTSDPELGSAKLLSLENQLMGNVIVLQADGKIRMFSKADLSQIPLAE